MNEMDKLILHYEGILKEKDKEIYYLRYKLLEIRKISKEDKVKRLTHWPPYDDKKGDQNNF